MMKKKEEEEAELNQDKRLIHLKGWSNENYQEMS